VGTGTDLVVYVIEKKRRAEKDTRNDEYRNTGCVFAHRREGREQFKRPLSISNFSDMGRNERLFELVSGLRYVDLVKLGSRTTRTQIKS
jgi:hypothetical protein